MQFLDEEMAFTTCGLCGASINLYIFTSDNLRDIIVFAPGAAINGDFCNAAAG